MRRNRGGFTILEVMIFLAISGALLSGAMIAINGQQNRTEFTLAMRDLDSKLQDTLNDVSTGNFSYNNLNCTVSGTIPVLSGSGGGVGEHSECLFLGEAIQFGTTGKSGGVDNNTRFAVYTVLGRRLATGGIPGNLVSVGSYAQANPTAQPLLTKYYNFEQGITTSHIYYTPTLGAPTIDTYSLLGVYTNFNAASTNSNADASQSLLAFTYKLAGDATYNSTVIPSAIDCINKNGSGTCPYDQALSTGGSKGLGISFCSNNATNQTAMITIFNTAQGVNTRLEYNPAGVPVC